ncbi:hypothetical protein [Demequina sp.]|uniref:variant leucine-rich repeat-containing protein n=1 Tax=Demequina sp. TaxID=2050685 RepID=UPI003A8A4200
MYWSAEEFVLVITGLLFLVVVASSFLPRVELTPMTRAALAIGAAAFIGAAALLARFEDVLFPPLVWFTPVVPLLALVVLVRDSRRLAHVPSEPEPVVVRRAPAFREPPTDTAATRALAARAVNPLATGDELARLAWRHESLRPLIAANPSTPSSVLEWLSSLGDASVSAAIAARHAIPAPRVVRQPEA